MKLGLCYWLIENVSEVLPEYLQFLHLSNFLLSRTVMIIVSLHFFFPIKKGQLLTAYAWENLEINNDMKKTLLFVLQTLPQAARWEH